MILESYPTFVTCRFLDGLRSDKIGPTPALLTGMSDEMDKWEVISVHTRQQLIDDGDLVDCSEVAREAGIKLPTALSRGVWELCVGLSPAAKRACNDESGRLWDVMTMLRHALRKAPEGATSAKFQVLCVTTRIRPSLVDLRVDCGPGDDAEPVYTVFLPHED